MRGKRRVVAAAVLHMENQRDVKHLRFQCRVFFIGTQKAQYIFRGGKLGVGTVDIQTVVAFIMVVCLIAVYCKHRESAD